MARANGKDPLDNDDGHKLKGLVLAGVMGRGSIMSLDYNGNEGMREALLAVLDEMEGPPTTVRRSARRPRKAVDWAVERHRLSSTTTTGSILPSRRVERRLSWERRASLRLVSSSHHSN